MKNNLRWKATFSEKSRLRKIKISLLDEEFLLKISKAWNVHVSMMWEKNIYKISKAWYFLQSKANFQNFYFSQSHSQKYEFPEEFTVRSCPANNNRILIELIRLHSRSLAIFPRNLAADDGCNHVSRGSRIGNRCLVLCSQLRWKLRTLINPIIDTRVWRVHKRGPVCVWD